MKITSLLITTVLLGTATTLAQTKPPGFGLPRGEFNASSASNPLPSGISASNKWRVAAPKQALQPTGPGLVHTARVAYAAYVDTDSSATTIIAFRRSTDGGLTWGPSQTLYTFQGEKFECCSFELLAEGHSVYVVVGYGFPWPPSHDMVWAFGSLDQGQTWDGPVLVNTVTDKLDVDEMEAVVSSSILHIAWEQNYNSTSREDVYYASMLLGPNGKLQVFTPVTRVNTAYAAKTFDVDTVELAADNNVVSIVWRDDRAGVNNYYSKTSLLFGRDFGNPSLEVAHTTSTSGSDGPNTAVSGKNVYVMWSSNENGVGDEIYLRYSNDSGQTFSSTQMISQGADIDGSRIIAQRNRVAIVWRDARNIPATIGVNSGNDIYIRVDELAGAGFAQMGKAPEIKLNDLSPPNVTGPPGYGFDSTVWGLDMLGDTIAVVWEEDWWNTQTRYGEDTVIGMSADGGKTWESRFVTGIGSAWNPPTTPGVTAPGGFDVDGPVIAIGLNRDVLLTWASDHVFASPGANTVVLSGLRLPELQNLTAQSKGLLLNLADTKFRGDPVVVLLSLTGTSPAFPLDPGRGIYVDLAVDLLTVAALGIPAVFIATPIDNKGQLAFPFIPDMKALLGGVNVWALPLSINLSGQWTFAGEPIKF